jgi:VanZ family protein
VNAAPWPRRRRLLVAWGLFVAFSLFVLFLGGSRFNAQETSGILAPLLQLLFPDLNASDRYLLHLKVRKVAHVIEYAVLGLLALRATFVTFRTAMARIAATALLLAALVATTDEIRQAFLENRTGSWRDVVLDVSGAGAAVGLALGLRRLLRARSRSAPP